MPEPLVYLNGRTVPASQAALPIWDAGVVQGAAVAEQTRTFRHRPYRLGCLGKHDKEGVALRIDLDAAMGSKRGTQQRAVRRQHLRIAVPQPGGVRSAGLDVREQQRQRAARQSGPARRWWIRPACECLVHHGGAFPLE